MEKPVSRKIYLSEQFTQESIKLVTKSIDEINDKDDTLERELLITYGLTYERKPIELKIDSFGGMVYMAFGLISVLENSKTPIHTIVTGCAMSCGFLLLICGKKRFAHKHSTILYHQVSSGGRGTLKELEDNIVETRRINKVLRDVTLAKTKISKARLKECYEKKIDWYITAEEALKLGIIDEIL
jgi:ATP-dependent Clp protease protease subunit